jgi:hypothetical protein
VTNRVTNRVTNASGGPLVTSDRSPGLQPSRDSPMRPALAAASLRAPSARRLAVPLHKELHLGHPHITTTRSPAETVLDYPGPVCRTASPTTPPPAPRTGTPAAPPTPPPGARCCPHLCTSPAPSEPAGPDSTAHPTTPTPPTGRPSTSTSPPTSPPHGPAKSSPKSRSTSTPPTSPPPSSAPSSACASPTYGPPPAPPSPAATASSASPPEPPNAANPKTPEPALCRAPHGNGPQTAGHPAEGGGSWGFRECGGDIGRVCGWWPRW